MEQFEPGKTISFRLPSDTPLHVSEYLISRKKELGRKFSSEIAPIFVKAVSQKALGNTDSDQITISLPEGLTAEQKEWMNHPNTRALIGQLLYQVVTKPNKAFEFNQTLENKQEENTAFKANAAIQKFAQKTFLDFDDDD
ncbi:hypothetical protein QUF86_28235 [Peribacillus sp. NJ11]|uniref:hypothetical protein n=1 Tax=unclassified Peribacillus TaxID=2675266 RepID=UPI0025A038ED|nr:hypothetical protein [Peribacillus sp. NJ11]MDM5224529.1 hypothetical protein [Peribacillus sp. NJ11]